MTEQTTHATADPIPRTPVLVSWSSGKDSAWTFHTLRQQGERYDVRGIFTTVTKTFDRVSIHSTPSWMLKLQSERLGVPLYEIPIPYPCSNAQYEAAMLQFLDRVRALPEHLTVSHFAFGDLFLEDIRRYREDQLNGNRLYTALSDMGTRYPHTRSRDGCLRSACHRNCSQSHKVTC